MATTTTSTGANYDGVASSFVVFERDEVSSVERGSGVRGSVSPDAARAIRLQASKRRHDALRDEIRDKLVAKGYTVQTEVTRSTTLGARRVDIEFVNPKRPGKVYALELKTGTGRYSTSQRLKDGQLAARNRYLNRMIRG